MTTKEEHQPKSIAFTDHIFDFAFHPLNNLIVVGLISGKIECFNYSIEKNSSCWSIQASKKSCRGVEFTPSGAHLMSISRDKSIHALDVSTGRMLYKIPKAHKFAINKICNLDTHLTATGDDEGIVKIWDMRTCKPLQEYKVHDDFIADMNYCKSRSSLLVAGGDGLLSIYDIRKPTDKIKMTTELDDELLSMEVIDNGNKVIAGSQSGALYSWNWDGWKESRRKWLGHPSSVDAMCKLDEQVICTGGNDGLLRMITVLPQYGFEGILGDHGEDFPIECIKLDHKQKYLASCGHDLKLKFWNIEFLFKGDNSKKEKRKWIVIDDDSDDDENVKNKQTNRKRQNNEFIRNIT